MRDLPDHIAYEWGRQDRATYAGEQAEFLQLISNLVDNLNTNESIINKSDRIGATFRRANWRIESVLDFFNPEYTFYTVRQNCHPYRVFANRGNQGKGVALIDIAEYMVSEFVKQRNV